MTDISYELAGVIVFGFTVLMAILLLTLIIVFFAKDWRALEQLLRRLGQSWVTDNIFFIIVMMTVPLLALFIPFVVLEEAVIETPFLGVFFGILPLIVLPFLASLWQSRRLANRNEQILAERLGELGQYREAGLERIHERLSPELLKRKFQGAATRVRILQTWLGLLEVGALGWIRDAALRGSKIEILLLDPTSTQVQYRAEALQMSVDHVRTNIEQDLVALAKLRSELQEEYDIQVRVYDSAPTIQMYEFDDTIIIGIYWRRSGSVTAPQLEIVDVKTGPDKSFLVRVVDEHFENLWEDKATRDASEALKELKNIGTVAPQQISDSARVVSAIAELRRLLDEQHKEQEPNTPPED